MRHDVPILFGKGVSKLTAPGFHSQGLITTYNKVSSGSVKCSIDKFMLLNQVTLESYFLDILSSITVTCYLSKNQSSLILEYAGVKRNRIEMCSRFATILKVCGFSSNAMSAKVSELQNYFVHFSTAGC
jgi:hypothetical protein